MSSIWFRYVMGWQRQVQLHIRASQQILQKNGLPLLVNLTVMLRWAFCFLLILIILLFILRASKYLLFTKLLFQCIQHYYNLIRLEYFFFRKVLRENDMFCCVICCQCKVIAENGEICPIGTPGELCTRGYNTMLYYWDEPTKTKEAISLDRWYHTG